jgi:hypothetical protein
MGSYCGYLRARLSCSLKHAEFKERQKERLHCHFAELVMNGYRPHEFKYYFRLWRKIISASQLDALVVELKSRPSGEAIVEWLLSKLKLPNQS